MVVGGQLTEVVVIRRPVVSKRTMRKMGRKSGKTMEHFENNSDTNFHGRSCSLIFRSRVGSPVSKTIPSPGSPPVLVPKPPLLPRYSLQMHTKSSRFSPGSLAKCPGSPPVLSGAPGSPLVLPRFPPGSPPVLPALYANHEN